MAVRVQLRRAAHRMWELWPQLGQHLLQPAPSAPITHTWAAAQISARMWELWPQLCECYDSWACDYLEHIMVPLENYVSRGTEAFLAGPYLQQVGLFLNPKPYAVSPRSCRAAPYSTKACLVRP